MRLAAALSLAVLASSAGPTPPTRADAAATAATGGGPLAFTGPTGTGASRVSVAKELTERTEPDRRPGVQPPFASSTTPARAARPDGLDVVFTRHIRGTGRSDLYIAKADGSVKRMTQDGTSGTGVFSPDGTQIAFASGRASGGKAPEIYVMDVTGKNVRRLTRSFRSSRVLWQNTQPAWAPDAKTIVFVRTKIVGPREDSDLWRIDVRGGRPVRLTKDPGREANPTFTPNGGIGFDRDGRIRVLSSGGLVDVRAGADPAWSPDRSYLAYVKADGIYVTLGQSERNVVAGGLAPTWSADGAQLVYQAATGGLQAMTLIGRETQAVTWPPGGAEDVFPSLRSVSRSTALRSTATLSPGTDGSLIAFARITGTGVSTLHVVRADGNGLRKLSSAPVDFDPAWTPNGKCLVFASWRGRRAGTPELYVRDLAGRCVLRLTRTPSDGARVVANAEPVVAPDGKRVVFSRDSYREGGDWSRDLYSVALTGGAVRQLTRTSGRESSPTIGRSGALYFERDGWIYETALGKTRRVARGMHPAKDPSVHGLVAFAHAGAIYVSRGGPPQKIASATREGGLSQPAWSPDGERLVYVAPDGLFTVNVDGSDVRRLTRTSALVHDVAPVWQPLEATR